MVVVVPAWVSLRLYVTPAPPSVPPLMLRAVTPAPYSMAATERPVTSNGCVALPERLSSVAVELVVSLASLILTVVASPGSKIARGVLMLSVPPLPTLTVLVVPAAVWTVIGSPANTLKTL